MSTKQIPPQYKTIKRDGKKTNWAAIIVGLLAVAMIAGGSILLFNWINSGDVESITGIFYTETPTITPSPTNTPITPTPTYTITQTPTITLTPTVSNTPTPSEPFPYIVESGDNIFDIAERFEVALIDLLIMNGLTNADFLTVGQELIIPAPSTILPSSTPVSLDLPKGSPIQYMVLPGDSLASIAAKFLTTIEDIMDANGIDNPELIYVGDPLIIRVNLITPTPTPLETVTPVFTPTPES